MRVIINGQDKEFNGPKNLRALIEEVCPDSSKVIAEVNGSIVKRDAWDAHSIREDDRVELVSFVGGG